MAIVERYAPGTGIPPVVAVTGGSWSGNTLKRVPPQSILRHIFVKSASALTTFDVLIYDRDNIPIRRFGGATQIVNDLTPTPVTDGGPITVSIENSSADENFIVLVCFADI